MATDIYIYIYIYVYLNILDSNRSPYGDNEAVQSIALQETVESSSDFEHCDR